MMHKAWRSIEVPYCFSRSSIKFHGHTGGKIDDLNPIWDYLAGRSYQIPQICLVVSINLLNWNLKIHGIQVQKLWKSLWHWTLILEVILSLNTILDLSRLEGRLRQLTFRSSKDADRPTTLIPMQETPEAKQILISYVRAEAAQQALALKNELSLLGYSVYLVSDGIVWKRWNLTHWPLGDTSAISHWN